MPLQTAILVDDLAADRRLATDALERAGWEVYTARNATDGLTLLERVLPAADPERTVVVTDLHMPDDPPMPEPDDDTYAGSCFALAVRARIQRGELPCVPILALTALTEREIGATALAFGCDAVLHKPVTPDLADRIEAALAREQTVEYTPVDADTLMGLLRQHLAEELAPPEVAGTEIDEEAVKAALRAYRREGLIGLGKSELARELVPDCDSRLRRGRHTRALLLRHLEDVRRLGPAESAEVLVRELAEPTTPAELCEELAFSSSEYYRRRRAAVHALLELLTK